MRARVKPGALHCCQTAHELCQDGRPVFHGVCVCTVFAIKFHAHGKRIELRGGQVSLQHPFKKRILLTAAIPEGLGFLCSWNLSRLSQFILPTPRVVLNDN